MTFKGMAVVTKILYLFPYHWNVFCTSLTFVTSGRLHVASVTQKLFFTSVFFIPSSPGQGKSSIRSLLFQGYQKKKNKKHCQHFWRNGDV